GIGPQVRAVADLARRLRQRLAGLEAFDQTKLLLVLEDAGGNAMEDRGALGAAHARPKTFVEGTTGDADGVADVLAGRRRPLTDDLAAVARALTRDGLAGLRVHRLPVH